MADEIILEKIKQPLRSVDDLTLLLLKSYLILEQAMNAGFREVFAHSDALNIGRLTFYQRLQVLRALDSTDSIKDILEFSEKLNSLINRLAHQLEPIGTEDAIRSFIETVAKSLPYHYFEVTGPPNLHMGMCIAYMCGRLNAFGRATRIEHDPLRFVC